MSQAGAFRAQGRACARLDSPFMARLMEALAETWDADGPLGAEADGWATDLGPGGASLPLRIAGGLHALHLQGIDPALSALFPPAAPGDSDLRHGVAATLERHEDFLLDWMQRPPQTNEIRRSAVVIAAMLLLADRFGLPFRLSELGASGGLNLMADRYALQLGAHRYGPGEAAVTLSPDWEGPLPPRATLRVTDRRGVDLTPLDPTHPEDRLRLLAYLWADQPERLARTRAALQVHAAPVDAADAGAWLESRLASPAPGALHLVFHTIAWQYFSPETQARARVALDAAGADATANAPLAWLGMEAAGLPQGAALSLRLWPGDHRLDLGLADFHGRWIRWQAAARLP